MISLFILVVILARGTYVAFRPKTSRVLGLVDAAFSALIVVLVARTMSWNDGLPVFVWWLLAAWAAALVGIQTSRLLAKTG